MNDFGFPIDLSLTKGKCLALYMLTRYCRLNMNPLQPGLNMQDYDHSYATRKSTIAP